MSSWTTTLTQTFTITHARHMAAKVAADLKRMQRLYDKPSDSDIASYTEEVVELLKAGCLEKVSYGFRRDGRWIEPTLQYTSQELAGLSAVDDDPGRIRPGADISGASFYSFLTYSSTLSQMSSAEQEGLLSRLPVQRTTADEPGVNGYLDQDRTYSSGGRALQRATVRSY